MYYGYLYDRPPYLAASKPYQMMTDYEKKYLNPLYSYRAPAPPPPRAYDYDPYLNPYYRSLYLPRLQPVRVDPPTYVAPLAAVSPANALFRSSVYRPTPVVVPVRPTDVYPLFPPKTNNYNYYSLGNGIPRQHDGKSSTSRPCFDVGSEFTVNDLDLCERCLES